MFTLFSDASLLFLLNTTYPTAYKSNQMFLTLYDEPSHLDKAVELNSPLPTPTMFVCAWSWVATIQ